jgi:hypothetical protein
MPVSPSPSQAVGRPDLGATLVEFDVQANQAGFVGLKIMPVVEVAEQSANIGRIPIEQLLQQQSTARASGGGYNRGNFTFDDFSYATKEHGWEEPVDDRNLRIYRRYFDAEAIAARRARNFVLQNYEQRVVAAATNTATFVDVARATAWTTPATAVPITDVLTRVKAARLASGMTPNTVVLDFDAYLAAVETAQVIDRLKYAGIDDVKNVTPNALAQLFKVKQVLISGGLKNTAAEGALTLSAVWPKDTVAVGYVAETDDVAEPCLGRTFHWSEDGSNIGTVLETYRDESKRCDVVRARMEDDEKVMYAECWELITGVLT